MSSAAPRMLDVPEGQPTLPNFKYVPQGPVEEGADGLLYQRQILDCDNWDLYDALNPFKRPPERIWQRVLTREGRGIYEDRSEARKPIPNPFRGKDIRELRGKHVGPVAILGNGQSLANHDLHSIPCPTVGMNRTYKGWAGYNGPNPDYYCLIDTPWLSKPQVRELPFIINCSSSNEDIGYRVVKCYRMKPFSYDLWRDGVCPVNTGYAAIQVAVYLGFSELYLLGFDFMKDVPQRGYEGADYPHFDGSPSGTGMFNQAKAFAEAAESLGQHGIKAFFVGSPKNGSNCFPHITFEEFCEQAR